MHTMQVMDAAGRLASLAVQEGHIAPEQERLILLSAAFHDVIHNEESDANERYSANRAAKEMTAIGHFSQEDIWFVQDAILATKVIEVRDSRIFQDVDGRSHFAKLLADADLSHFGGSADTYWRMANAYFRETHPTEPIGGPGYREFSRGQLQFVANKKFHTPEADQLFNNGLVIVESIQDYLAGVS